MYTFIVRLIFFMIASMIHPVLGFLVFAVYVTDFFCGMVQKEKEEAIKAEEENKAARQE